MPRALPKPNTGILDIAPYVGGKSAGKSGVRAVKLSSNETPLGPSPRAIKAYIDAAKTLQRYPEGGAALLREAIGKTFSIPPERIACGAGSDELIGLLIHAYAGRGDDILMSRHGFLMYKIYAQGFGVNTVMAPEKNLRTDVDAMLAALTPKTKIVFVANPNNPTGSYITRKELARLHAGLPPEVLLVIDAAYSEYADLPDYTSGEELVEKHDNVIMLRTFSKIYGLAALRLGWAYAPAHVIDVLNRIRGPFNISTPSQMAGIAAVQDKAFTRRARVFNDQWLGWLTQEISALGLTVYPSIANFVLVEFAVGKYDAKKANAFLADRGLIVRDVTAYGLSDCLRISVGLEKDNQAVVKALRDFLKS
jgi:histidinol-phosphate aminotransferase